MATLQNVKRKTKKSVKNNDISGSKYEKNIVVFLCHRNSFLDELIG